MFADNIAEFIQEKLDQLAKLAVDVSGLELDHFGYQASSAADFERLKIEASETGQLVHEGLVNGRRVAIYKLHKPLKHSVYSLSAFELIEPKPGQVANSSLDHIEFVLKQSFQEFVAKNSGVDWDTSIMTREEFPKVAYKFADGTSVKFHLVNILAEV